MTHHARGVVWDFLDLPVSLLSRSARLALHSRGDLYVHGETAPVHIFGCDAGETAIRHPLPRGPTERLGRLDDPVFPSRYDSLRSAASTKSHV